MIVRDYRRTVTDHGPAAGRVDGLEAAEVMALRAEVYVAPVERRFLSPEELARVRQDPEPILKLRSYSVAAEKVTPTEMRERRARGGTNAAREKRATMSRVEAMARARQLAWASRTTSRKVDREAVLDALRQSQGNQARAAALVGLTAGSLRQRVRTMQSRGVLPSDVASMLRGRGGWSAAA